MEKKPQDTESRHADKYIIRFPEGMRDRIAAAAKANGRSMNSELIARLEASFEQAESDLLKETLIAELQTNSAVQRAQIERLIQQCGVMGLGAKMFFELLEAGTPPDDARVQGEVDRILDEADAAIEAASVALPHQAILDLKAAIERRTELARRHIERLADAPRKRKVIRRSRSATAKEKP